MYKAVIYTTHMYTVSAVHVTYLHARILSFIKIRKTTRGGTNSNRAGGGRGIGVEEIDRGSGFGRRRVGRTENGLWGGRMGGGGREGNGNGNGNRRGKGNENGNGRYCM